MIIVIIVTFYLHNSLKSSRTFSSTLKRVLSFKITKTLFEKSRGVFTTSIIGKINAFVSSTLIIDFL